MLALKKTTPPIKKEKSLLYRAKFTFISQKRLLLFEGNCRLENKCKDLW